MNQQTQYWVFLSTCKALLKNISELLFLADYRNDTERGLARDMICSIKKLEHKAVKVSDLEGLLTQGQALHGIDENSKKAVNVVREDLEYLIKLHISVKGK